MTKEKPKPYKEEWLAQWDEQTLSDLEIKGMYYRENLKQAIKRLKEEIGIKEINREEWGFIFIDQLINKIFGDKLTK